MHLLNDVNELNESNAMRWYHDYHGKRKLRIGTDIRNTAVVHGVSICSGQSSLVFSTDAHGSDKLLT